MLWQVFTRLPVILLGGCPTTHGVLLYGGAGETTSLFSLTVFAVFFAGSTELPVTRYPRVRCSGSTGTDGGRYFSVSRRRRVTLRLHLTQHPLPCTCGTSTSFAARRTTVQRGFYRLLNVPRRTNGTRIIMRCASRGSPQFSRVHFRFRSRPKLSIPYRLVLPGRHRNTLPLIVYLRKRSANVRVSLKHGGFSGSGPSRNSQSFTVRTVTQNCTTIIVRRHNLNRRAVPA